MLDYRHLINMTDKTGMLQFSQNSTPDPSSGYTLDDNARAFMIALEIENGYLLARHYADFLYACQQGNSWSNFMLNGHFTHQFDSEDSFGRAIMACCLGTDSIYADIRSLCGQMLQKNLPQTLNFKSPRAIAYVLTGLCHTRPALYNNLHKIIQQLGGILINLYQNCRDNKWFWFENSLTYCNGILPQSMFCLYRLTGDKKTLNIAYESLGFLSDTLLAKGYLNIIGNEGWYQKGFSPARFDQQPVDAASTAFACLEAYNTTGKIEYLEKAKASYQWYHGRNIHGLTLYDKNSGGCFDALTANGVNLNQGAEAILSLLLTEQYVAHNLNELNQVSG